MRIFTLVYMSIATILLVVGLLLAFTSKKNSKKAKTGYLMSAVGCLMSGVYFFVSLIW